LRSASAQCWRRLPSRYRAVQPSADHRCRGSARSGSADSRQSESDITIVAFLDYNCPFCKKSAPDLDRIVKEDGNVRPVHKDWPI
jgi:protein-disulfide isomerase